MTPATQYEIIGHYGEDLKKLLKNFKIPSTRYYEVDAGCCYTPCSDGGGCSGDCADSCPNCWSVGGGCNDCAAAVH